MNPILRNVLAVIAGIALGGFINMQIIKFGSPYFPLPEGVDPNDANSIKANIHRYSFQNFIVPFLAHAIGSLVGAFFATKIAATSKRNLGLIVAGVFMLGGLGMIIMVGGPIWFIITDLALAYIPMGLLGAKLANLNSKHI